MKFSQALKPGTPLQGGERPYEVVSVLGQGGFGITYLVNGRLRVGTIEVNAQFAVKEFFVKSCCWRNDDGVTMACAPTMHNEVHEDLDSFVKEGKRLQRVCRLSPHIVNVNEVFSANGTAYYVMEYLDGGDLRSFIRGRGEPMGEDEMMSIARPIGNAVQMLHEHKMLHLDIKPENIVMRASGDKPGERVPVLIDFGVAMHFDRRGNPTTKSNGQGTSRGYSPMEQYAAISRFSPALDVYAFSATCYYMLTGKDPAIAFDIRPGQVAQELRECGVSEAVAAAINHGMAPLGHDRPADVNALLERLMAAAPEVAPAVDEEPRVEAPLPVDAASSPPVPSANDPANDNVTRRFNEPKRKTAARSLPIKGIIWGVAATLVGALVIFLVAKGVGSSPSSTVPAGDTATAAAEVVAPAPRVLTVQSITVHDYPNQEKWGDYVYSGEVMSDNPTIPHGKGKGVYKVGQTITATYEGHYVNGVRQDTAGVYTWSNGDRFTGSFVNDRFEGNGTINSSNGDRCSGTFKDGQFYSGDYAWSNGDHYSGTFQDGQFYTGTFTFANGKTVKYVNGKQQ